MNKIEIDYETCNACKICVKACFIDVLRWDEAEDRPVAAYPEDCVQCNACEIACSTGSREVIPDYEHFHWPSVV